MSNTRVRVGIARAVLSLDAVLGILAIGVACLYGAAYQTCPALPIVFAIFLPTSALWFAFCYLTYKGLANDRVILQAVFWLNVLCNTVVFPVGTGIAAVCV